MDDIKISGPKDKDSRKYRTAVAAGSALFVIHSVALCLALMVPRATDAAERLHIDGSYFLWSFGLAAATVMGYGAINVWQKRVFAKLAEVKLGDGK